MVGVAFCHHPRNLQFLETEIQSYVSSCLCSLSDTDLDIYGSPLEIGFFHFISSPLFITLACLISASNQLEFGLITTVFWL